jgi:pimeloyl-ACP methyl ester carboxylesterase
MDLIEEGQGETVVLIHGGASSNRQWKALIDALKPSFRVLAPNLRGAGSVPAWHGAGAYTLAQAAEPVLRAAGDAQRVSLVGHSIGGAIAMEAAMRLGPRLARLVLFEPAVYAILRHAGDPAYQMVANLHQAVLECARRADWSGVAAHFMHAFAGAAAWDGMSAERQGRIAAASRHTLHEWDALLGDARALEDWCAALRARTLLVAAPDTWPPLRAIAERLRTARPDWSFASVPEGGHMAVLTKPEWVNPLVRDFLAAEVA